MSTIRRLSWALLGCYVILLLWLVLFKFSLNLPSVLDSHIRSVNLIPFAVMTKSNVNGAIYNLIAFIPLGLLLGVTIKRATIWQRLAWVLLLSIAVEVTQYVLAIGITDITDVITNTAGGLLGIVLYGIGSKRIASEKFDRYVTIGGIVLLVLFVAILGRFLAHGLQFQGGHHGVRRLRP